jgi:hypothetical protein
MPTPNQSRVGGCSPRPCSPRFAVYPGEIRSQRDGDVHHIGFARLCELYNVPPALCVDMSRPENRVGRDLSKLVALRPSYRGNYTLTASERGACPLVPFYKQDIFIASTNPDMDDAWITGDLEAFGQPI